MSASIYESTHEVDEAAEVCQNRSIWRNVDPACPNLNLNLNSPTSRLFHDIFFTIIENDN